MRQPLEHDLRARLRRDALLPGVLAALCLVGYARALGRYFVSEDFLILRQLAAGSFWETAWAHLTGPLLGVTFVQFYRPVSALLLHGEWLLWGAWPAPYLLTHLGVHLANAILVHRLALRWSGGSRLPAAGVAAIFALYPLHLNTVVFIASFAGLFGATFFLASLLLYERARAGGGVRAAAGSAACFALALGSYEQTVVLPVFLVARELFTGPDAGRGAWRRLALRRWLPYFALLAVYFLARQAFLGQLVGGYSGFRQRLLAGEVERMGRSVLAGLVHLIRPEYDHAVPGAAAGAVGLVLLLATIWAVRRGGIERRLWLSGLLWVLATQAPFAFEGVVPGNGRYWYLTSIGLGLLIAVAARMLGRAAAAAWPRLEASLVTTALTLAVSLYYLVLLVHYAGVYAEAGRTARTIQGRLLEVAGSGERVFIAGVPDFVRGPLKTPLAQVFHWGLSDALRPPFVAGGPDVYPLPPFADADLLPVTERADLGTAWRWNAGTGAFEALASPAAAASERIAVRIAGADALQFRGDGGAHRLVILAGGNASVYGAAGTPQADGWVDAPVPEPVVGSMRRLYGGEVYAWIERRERGRPVAVSRLLSITPAP